ncbi:MAG: SAM-dependent chlorinase/fluorinase [Chloroflexi bacterium]|nr:SAM-dependent chlorinase/fluorinase [Chloroflexota bacterium]
MAIVSITTDFGTEDGFVGTMKGVIWGICPEAKIADISHEVPPQNVRSAALLLLGSTEYFPEGTVHVVVVDPGVGTARRPIAARIGGQIYVAPDNGVLTLLYERAEAEGREVAIVHLDKPEYYLPVVSTTFHGRDIFAPCGAHLACGVPLHEMGTPIADPVRLTLPKPVRTESGLVGEIIHIDHFGNLASNIRAEHLGQALDKKDEICINVCGVEINGMVDAFGERQVGELTVLMNSEGYLEVSVVNGNAAAQLNAKTGDPIEALFS